MVKKRIGLMAALIVGGLFIWWVTTRVPLECAWTAFMCMLPAALWFIALIFPDHFPGV